MAILLCGALLTGWASWFLWARVNVYAVSDSARLEVDKAAHPIEAPIGGRVVQVRLALGAEVAAGEPLVELDTTSIRLELEEQKVRRAAALAELVVLRAELEAESQAKKDDRQSKRLLLEESRARLREAEAGTRLADDEAERLGRLRSQGSASEMDLVRSEADARRKRALLDSLRIEVDRRDLDEHTQGDRRTRIERLRREATVLQGQIATSQVTIDRLETVADRGHVRAPVAGRVAEVGELRVGSMVREGDRLGAVVPAGPVRVVAEFAPARALGRVRRGQQAHVRLEGFPWTQFGTVRATVSEVASEPRGGRIRVELVVARQAGSPSAIVLEHGLPGSVEVEVEKVSPAVMALRAAGALLSHSPESPTVTPETAPAGGDEVRGAGPRDRAPPSTSPSATH